MNLGQRDEPSINEYNYVETSHREIISVSQLEKRDGVFTHPDAQRFFMTISEAASLVLLSAAFGTAGGLFVLDMGDEVRIEQLAERLVRLKGLRLGRDVRIEYTGLRPGEKMREELHATDERLLATERPAVWRVEPMYGVDADALLAGLRGVDARRRNGELSATDYPRLLRALIDLAVREAAPV